jgi:hypothetical protein
MEATPIYNRGEPIKAALRKGWTIEAIGTLEMAIRAA